MSPIGCALFLDFGASRVKAAISCDGLIVESKDYTSPPACKCEDRHYEIDPSLYFKIFFSALSFFHNYDIQAIFVCSEMHGFILLNDRGCPITNYISWKDERSLLKDRNGKTSFETITSQLGQHFQRVTGMQARPCYPLFNIHKLLRDNQIASARVCTLPDFLCTISGFSENLCHSTMAAGLGFYNIYKKSIDDDIVKCVSKTTKLEFPTVTDEIAVGGYVVHKQQKIPVYIGVGDHQCAVLGAGNSEATISVNLGTGSQVSVISKCNVAQEQRPFFFNQYLSVITHIPSGRALNVFCNFLRALNPQFDFWGKLASIDLSMMQQATLDISLTLFESAWLFEQYGNIGGIRENNFTVENFLSSLFKSYIMQYVRAIQSICPFPTDKTILISGGIGTKLPNIALALSHYTKVPAQVDKNLIDETLHGLMKLANRQ